MSLLTVHWPSHSLTVILTFNSQNYIWSQAWHIISVISNKDFTESYRGNADHWVSEWVILAAYLF